MRWGEGYETPNTQGEEETTKEGWGEYENSYPWPRPTGQWNQRVATQQNVGKESYQGIALRVTKPTGYEKGAKTQTEKTRRLANGSRRRSKIRTDSQDTWENESAEGKRNQTESAPRGGKTNYPLWGTL